MAFTVTDFEDLLKLLGQHPEWQAELRRLLVGDQLAAIDSRLEALGEAEERTEARLAELAAAQKATELALQALTARVDQFAADTARRFDWLETEVGSLRGWRVESRLKERIPGYFGTIVRKPHPVSPFDIASVERARDEGRISDGEWRQLGNLDILIEGGPLESPSYLAIEASAVVDRTDVERASTRAAILSALGLSVTPWVAGESIVDSAARMAEELGVQTLVAPGLLS
ncbi:MAG: hypothetical protein ACRDHF_09405 [Tepidiformaceae bacterium]